jgi:hypothetical protein
MPKAFLYLPHAFERFLAVQLDKIWRETGEDGVQERVIRIDGDGGGFDVRRQQERGNCALQ